MAKSKRENPTWESHVLEVLKDPILAMEYIKASIVDRDTSEDDIFILECLERVEKVYGSISAFSSAYQKIEK